MERTKLWKVAATFAEYQKKAAMKDPSELEGVDWKLVEELWFDYLEEELISPPAATNLND